MAAVKKGGPPAGFKKVETGIGGFWKPSREGQSIQGRVNHEIEASGLDGKPNKFFILTLTEVDGVEVHSRAGKKVSPHEGMLVGVGGKTLMPFLSQNLGREVWIAYKGLGEPKKGQNPPKLYETYVQAEAD